MSSRPIPTRVSAGTEAALPGGRMLLATLAMTAVTAFSGVTSAAVTVYGTTAASTGGTTCTAIPPGRSPPAMRCNSTTEP